MNKETAYKIIQDLGATVNLASKGRSEAVTLVGLSFVKNFKDNIKDDMPLGWKECLEASEIVKEDIVNYLWDKKFTREDLKAIESDLK